MDTKTQQDKIVCTNNRDLARLRERAIVPDPNNHKWSSGGGGIGRYNRPGNHRTIDGKVYDSWGWYWNDSWGNHPTWKPYQ